MVGWPARWESGVGRDQPHLPLTEHVGGLDPSTRPLPSPTLSRPHPSHIHSTHDHHTNHAELTRPPSEPRPSSAKSPECSNRDLAAHHARHHHISGHPAQALVPDNGVHSSSSPLDVNSEEGGPELHQPGPRLQLNLHQHSALCHQAPLKLNYPPPQCSHAHPQHLALPTSNSSSSSNSPSSNGTSRAPSVPSGPSHKPWGSSSGDTAPLTTNGDLGCLKLNGIVVKNMVKVESPVLEEEEEEEEEGEEEEELGNEEDGKGNCEDEEREDLKCGLGGWCSPSWVQPLANKQMFLLVFCLASVLQGMYYTYFVSVLTTIEKLFQLKSKTTGIIMSATEMGQIGGALLLTYYGGQGHRPKWIGWGVVLFAFCAFLCSLPHFLFGKQLLQRHMETTPSQQENPLSTANTCRVPWTQNLTIAPSLEANVTKAIDTMNHTELDGLLDMELLEDKCDSPDGLTRIVLSIFFLSLLGVGIGQTAAYNLGIPYIDDNVASRDTPIYFAGTSGVRILGPTLGFVLGSFCTRLYVEPLTDPGITPSDPRWIGAWWLGLVVVSVALFLTSCAIFAFPRRLPSAPKSSHSSHLQPHHRNPSLKDFPKAVRRLLKNRILMLRTASNVLHILPIAGLYTFLPKYLESQFRLPVHSAAMVSGIGGIMVMGVGIFASGVFIRRAKPSAQTVAGWIAFTALIYSVGMLILMFVGCPLEDFVGLVDDESGKHFMSVCDRTCVGCDNQTFAPVCDSQGQTYFSACHIGCSNVTHHNNSNELVFSDCECLQEGETVVLRLCEMECNNFIWYVIIFSVFVLIHSTSEVGGMLVTLRCVDPKDKAMALGLISVAIGLFGNVPCPIIYGAVVDSACIQWRKTCGEAGACQLYDSDVFRMFFHGMTGGVMMLAFIVDVVVWHKAKSVSFSDSEENAEEATPMNPKSLSPSPSTPAVTEQTPTTSTVHEISPMLSASEGDPSVSNEEHSESSL